LQTRNFEDWSESRLSFKQCRSITSILDMFEYLVPICSDQAVTYNCEKCCDIHWYSMQWFWRCNIKFEPMHMFPSAECRL
jgi:hypothetical protein